jgi:L-erythro-3,5-diaminohexanoate dehydrogenase
MRGDRYGTHRVISPKGALPQAAWQLDNDAGKVFDDELVIDVETLNVDSASFRQMEEAAGSADGVAKLLLSTVAERGKQHNPVTGSGGMLVGRVARVGGAARPVGEGIAVGDRVATLVSLTLTPLRIERVRAVHLATHQVDVDGTAILFASGACARMPTALDERVALAALDVAGAAPQVSRLTKQGDAVLILGCGGKSGLLCSAAARRAGAAKVIGIERSEAAAAGARRLGACTEILVADAADGVAISRATIAAAGREVDLAVSCVNVPDAEMGAILATRDGGTVYFFSMATSFTKAALGAEGVSRDVTMLIGNGYCPGHAQATLALLDGEPTLRAIFEERFRG